MSELMAIMATIPWFEIVRTTAPVATAWIAYRALRNWQRQDRAKREAEFLDELIDATHQHIVEMQRPIAVLRKAKIGMASHVQDWDSCEESEQNKAGAVTYICKAGEHDGKLLKDELANTEPTVVKLKSLAVKGQVFKFRDYQKCYNAVIKLTWHFDRLNYFAMVIASSNWNWENPEVSDLLAKVMAIDPDETKDDLSANGGAIVEFSREIYTRIYG